MNQMEIFKNPEFGSIRIVVDGEKYFFCGMDVARALGYKDTVNALKAHCKEDGVAFYHLTDSLGREQKAKFISEGKAKGGIGMRLLLKLLAAPVVLALTLFVWLCMGVLYLSSLVLGIVSTIVGLLGLAVLVTYSVQNGVILLVIAFLVSPAGLPIAAVWLVGKVQDLRYAIKDAVYG